MSYYQEPPTHKQNVLNSLTIKMAFSQNIRPNV